MKKSVSLLLNYLPVIYNTRHSYVFSLYERKIELQKIKTNIITDTGHAVVLISETPHFLCACEFLRNKQALNELKFLDKCLINDYIVTNNLVNSSRYIDYVNQAHPETDNIEAFMDFVILMMLYLFKEIEFKILVQRRINKSGNYWLLIDGLHRSSILLAMNKIIVSARVKFP